MTEEEQQGRKNIWFRHLPPWVMVALMLLLPLLVSIILLFYSPSRELSRRTVCKTRLRGLGNSAAIYQSENGDLEPVNWEELIEDARLSPRMLVCPSSGTEYPAGSTLLALEGHMDYVLISGLGDKALSDRVRAFELPRNHKQHTVNMLHVSGYVSNTHDFSDFMQQLQLVNDDLAELRRMTP